MENFKHTKGEWVGVTDGDANFYGVSTLYGETTNKNWLFRIQQNGELSTVEQQANIKLMLYAPKLLKALVSLIAQTEHCELDNEQVIAVVDAKEIIKNLSKQKKSLTN